MSRHVRDRVSIPDGGTASWFLVDTDIKPDTPNKVWWYAIDDKTPPEEVAAAYQKWRASLDSNQQPAD